MGSLSNFAEDALLNHVLNTAYTAPATVYLALCTADPTDAGTGASMSETANTGAYARTAITFAAAAARAVAQNANVAYPQATGNYAAPITHWGIVDSATHGAGNMLAHGAFNDPFQPVTGNDVTVPSGQVIISKNAGSGHGPSNYLVHKWLDLMFRNQAFTKPATYDALSNTVIDDADLAVSDFTEVVGTDYARVQININGGASPTWSTVSGGVASNLHDVVYPTVGAGGWTQLVAHALVDTASGAGNILFYDSSNITDQTPVATNIVRFLAGDLTITVS